MSRRDRRVALSVGIAVLLLGAGCGSQQPSAVQTVTSTPTSATWTQTVKEVESGVVRISSEGCEKGQEGTGFLVGEDLVLTAGHVVEDSASIQVEGTQGATDATILGIAPNSDVALLRTADPITGHVFVKSASQPALADEVAALGFPAGLALTFTQGRVSGLDRPVGTGTFEGEGFIQTDAAINPGNSGGPLIDIEGDVMGVVSAKLEWADEAQQRPAEGTAFAAPADRAFDLVERWVAADQEVPATRCESASPDSIAVDIRSDAAEAQAIADALVAHGTGINEGDYAAAFDQFTPAMQERVGGLERWSQGLQSSFWRRLVLEEVTVDGGTATTRVALRTEQDALDGWEGQTCTDWQIEYGLTRDAGWRIDSAQGVGTPQDCSASG